MMRECVTGAEEPWRPAGRMPGVVALLLSAALRAVCASEPTAPYALQAECDSLSAVRLTWVDASSNETGFSIERSVDALHYSAVASVGPDVTAYTNSGLAHSTLYLFRVRATGADGDSEYSNWHFAATRRPVSTNECPVFVKASWTPEARVVVTWREFLGDETGFEIERATTGAYTVVGSAGPNAEFFADTNGILPDTAYTYRVRAANSTNHSEYGSAPASLYWTRSTGYIQGHANDLPSPTGAIVHARSTSSVRVQWQDVCTNETGHRVLFSTDARHFHEAGTVTSNVTEYVHTGVFPEIPYHYRVAAMRGGASSLPSETASIMLSFDDGLAAPTNLQAVVISGSQVGLTWQDRSSSETGFAVEVRSGLTALDRIVVGPGVTTCMATNAGSASNYRVQALGAGGDSRYSNLAEPNADYSIHWGPVFTSPETPDRRTNAVHASGPVTNVAVTIVDESRITFRELVVYGTAGNDSIEISQTNDAVFVTANGQAPESYAGPFGGLAVKGGEGNDTVIVAPNVTLRARLYGGPGDDAVNAFGSGKTFVVTVGGGSDTAAGNGRNTSYWTDATGVDTVCASREEIMAGRVHRISGFYKGISVEPLGQSLSEADMFLYSFGPYTRFPENSLWGLGPSMFDVNQGFHQNCPSTGYYQGFGLQEPDRLEEMAVDLGDGTYAVQYGDTAAQTFARVDGDLADGFLACIGPTSNLWWMVMEKVVSWGYQLSGASVSSGYSLKINGSGDEVYPGIRDALTAKRFITTGTSGEMALDALTADHGHNYGLMGAYKDRNGKPRFIVRDPYGVHYKWAWPPCDPELGLKDLSLEQFQANFSSPAATDSRFIHADAGTNQAVVNANGLGAELVELNGAASWSPTASVVAFTWMEDGVVIATGATASVSMSLGLHRIELVIEDANGIPGHDLVVISVLPVSSFASVGECGRVTATQANDTVWHTLDFSREYVNPVVVMGPPSYGDASPATIRVKNVTPAGCQWQILEWDYQLLREFASGGKSHGIETVPYVVMEAGVHTLADGTLLEAGYVAADSATNAVLFGCAFPGVPVVLSQVASADDSKTVVTRQQGVGTGGFVLSLQSQESSVAHGYEYVGWMAIEQGTRTNGGVVTRAAVTPDAVTDAWYPVSFGSAFTSAPVVVAAMQTRDDSEPATLRHRNLTTGGVELKVEEEQSLDDEMAHGTEVLGYLALGAVGRMPGSRMTDADHDSLPDAWEVAWFGSTNAPLGGAQEDWDGDGFCNEHEYRAGTDPKDSHSSLQILDVLPSGAGNIIRWQSGARKKYSIMASTNLLGSVEMTVAGGVQSTAPINVHTDSVNTALSPLFYRVKLDE